MALSGDTNPGLPFINSIIHEPEGLIKKETHFAFDRVP
jgi:hypothetical protein